jgi:hypothetical protein
VPPQMCVRPLLTARTMRFSSAFAQGIGLDRKRCHARHSRRTSSRG